jgi:tRNA 2-thiouridine synthesizing protein A
MSDLQRQPPQGGTDTLPARPVAHRYLDTVGLFCPIPILKTAEAMRRMQNGEILHVVSDDRVILIDMPAWCRSQGQQLVHTEQQGREYHLYVQKTDRRARPPVTTE